MLTAAVAMGVGQLTAGLTVAQSFPCSRSARPPSISRRCRSRTSPISTFGVDDKNALLVGILVILAAFAAVIGILAVRRLALGLLGLAVFACIGLAAALTRPTATAGYVIPTLAGTAAGAFALTRLVRAARGLGSRPSRSCGHPDPGRRAHAARPARARRGRERSGPGHARVLVHLPAQPR